MVKRKRTFHQYFIHIGESGLFESCALLGHRHVELVIGHSAFTGKVIADKIASVRAEDLPCLGMKPSCMALVTEFVNGLKRDDSLEAAQALGPGCVAKASFHELGSFCKRTKPLRSKLVHCR